MQVERDRRTIKKGRPTWPSVSFHLSYGLSKRPRNIRDSRRNTQKKQTMNTKDKRRKGQAKIDPDACDGPMVCRFPGGLPISVSHKSPLSPFLRSAPFFLFRLFDDTKRLCSSWPVNPVAICDMLLQLWSEHAEKTKRWKEKNEKERTGAPPWRCQKAWFVSRSPLFLPLLACDWPSVSGLRSVLAPLESFL